MSKNSQFKHVVQGFIDRGRLPTALGEAARWGEIDMVRQLLDKGVAVDARAENGATALMLASSGGQAKIVRLLIDRGADVNARDDRNGYTALIWSVAGLHPEKIYLAVVKILLDSGADASVRAPDGKTALEFAKGRDSAELVELLS